jgi:hypothetical protein
MTLFKQNVNEIKGPLADLLKAHSKPEHQRDSNNQTNYQWLFC